MKDAFILDWGTFPDHTVVFIGMNGVERLKWAKKNIKDVKKVFLEGLEYQASKEHDGDLGGFIRLIKTGSSSILFITDWENTIQDFGTLVHELSHAIDDVLVDYRGVKDTEAKAYQMEFLVRQILCRLNKTASLKNKGNEK